MSTNAFYVKWRPPDGAAPRPGSRPTPFVRTTLSRPRASWCSAVLWGPAREILLIINSASEDAVRTRLGADPWSGSGLLQIARVEPWTVLLDSRSA